MTLTYNLQFQSLANYDHVPYTCKFIKVKDQSVQKIEWKDINTQTNGWTERERDRLDLPW